MMNETVQDYVAWLASALVLLAAGYLASAPPIMLAIFSSSGGHLPLFYMPVISMIESDFNGPLLWYFNDVWGCGIALLGEVSTPWYVGPFYALCGVVGLGILLLPFWRRRKKT
jgi:hypothetical protein